MAGAFLAYLFVDALPINQDGSYEALFYFMGNIVVLALAVPVFYWLRRTYGRPADST